MQFVIKIKGLSPIIQHAGTGIDTETDISKQISKLTKKKASSRTSSENEQIREMETIRSLWLNNENEVIIPEAAIRACIESAAKKTREGPAVREGMFVVETSFEYSRKKYGETIEEISRSAQFTVPVVVQKSRVMRTRAKFDCPWSVTFDIEADPDLIDAEKMQGWIATAGRRIGLGDWRPQKSGNFGRFQLESFEELST